MSVRLWERVSRIIFPQFKIDTERVSVRRATVMPDDVQ